MEEHFTPSERSPGGGKVIVVREAGLSWPHLAILVLLPHYRDITSLWIGIRGLGDVWTIQFRAKSDTRSKTQHASLWPGAFTIGGIMNTFDRLIWFQKLPC